MANLAMHWLSLLLLAHAAAASYYDEDSATTKATTSPLLSDSTLYTPLPPHSSYIVVSPAHSSYQARKICQKHGHRLARVNKTNLPRVMEALQWSGQQSGWIDSYDGGRYKYESSRDSSQGLIMRVNSSDLKESSSTGSICKVAPAKNLKYVAICEVVRKTKETKRLHLLKKVVIKKSKPQKKKTERQTAKPSSYHKHHGRHYVLIDNGRRMKGDGWKPKTRKPKQHHRYPANKAKVNVDMWKKHLRGTKNEPKISLPKELRDLIHQSNYVSKSSSSSSSTDLRSSTDMVDEAARRHRGRRVIKIVLDRTSDSDVTSSLSKEKHLHKRSYSSNEDKKRKKRKHRTVKRYTLNKPLKSRKAPAVLTDPSKGAKIAAKPGHIGRRKGDSKLNFRESWLDSTPRKTRRGRRNHSVSSSSSSSQSSSISHQRHRHKRHRKSCSSSRSSSSCSRDSRGRGRRRHLSISRSSHSSSREVSIEFSSTCDEVIGGVGPWVGRYETRPGAAGAEFISACGKRHQKTRGPAPKVFRGSKDKSGVQPKRFHHRRHFAKHIHSSSSSSSRHFSFDRYGRGGGVNLTNKTRKAVAGAPKPAVLQPTLASGADLDTDNVNFSDDLHETGREVVYEAVQGHNSNTQSVTFTQTVPSGQNNSAVHPPTDNLPSN